MPEIELDDGKFIKTEEQNNSKALIHLNWRLFSSLELFWKVFPLTVLAVLIASAGPSLFRWYAGEYISHASSFYTMSGLAFLVFLGTFSRISAWALFEIGGMWSTQKIYADMIRSLSNTRTTFFDENPSGRIMNRLIRDYDELRSTAIIFVGDFFNANVEILSIAVVASLASPIAALLVVPLYFIFFFIQGKRSKKVEYCRSLSAIAGSHVINRKNDLIEGREIFILYGRADHLLERMLGSLRNYLRASLLTMKVDILASFWIRTSAEFFSLCVLALTVTAIYSHKINFSIAGVIISSLFGITGSIGWLDFSSSMVSRSAPHLRRVFEFVDLPREDLEEKALPSQAFTHRVDSSVPVQGDLQFRNYTMSYRKGSPTILKNINFTIPAGSKAALVGRTGSGKSSVMQALMRMVYVHSGDILIGNQSIFEMEISDLRRQFGVVPQFPFLFEGTLRLNLDRSGRTEDLALKKAMEVVGLPYSLDFVIPEGGSNLSVGERQLVCLARVIASKKNFILMDEPTSGLDPETDSRINWLLRNTMKSKTLLTIAHRKESLKNYDIILEMNKGSMLSGIS